MRSIISLALLGIVACNNNPHMEIRPLRAPKVEAPKVMQSEQRPKEPLVTSGTSPQRCLFKDDNNYWCYTGISPMLTTGWKWNQQTSSTDWEIQLYPFIQTQMDTTSVFYIDRLITSTWRLLLNSFKTNAIMSATFDISGQMCYGFGWKS
jgi:hypothetical protein